MKYRVLASLLLVVVGATRARAEESAGAAHYASGPLPPAFDTYVSHESKGYEVKGKYYDFGGLIDALKSAGANAVLVQGLTTNAEVQCAAILGLASGSHVFVVDKNGGTKGLNWTADEQGVAKAEKACRALR